MTIQILSLILLSAGFHSIWNILLKGCKDSQTASWLQLVFAAIGLLPLYFWMTDCQLDARVLPTLIFSGCMQFFYYLLLSRCYTIGNLDRVYPLVRGSAPIFVYFISCLLGTESPSLRSFGAVSLIVGGIYMMNMASLKKEELLSPFKILASDKSTRISILVGITIAIYTVTDKVNLKYEDPITIYYAVCLIPAVMMTPFMLNKEKIRQELSHFGAIRIAVISILTFLTDFLVLMAMKVSNASYVSSIREISVVFVVIYMSIKMKRRDWQPKIVGAVMIFCGIIMISI